MNSNGISTNGTRSPMQGANPESAKYIHKYQYTHTYIKYKYKKPLPPISMHHEHNHLNASYAYGHIFFLEGGLG